MSEYHVVQTIFKDEECIAEALKEMGYTPEVHAEAVNIGGSTRAKAHVVVRREQFGGYRDIGFEKTKSGEIVCHCDNWDWSEGGRQRFDMPRMRIKYNQAVTRKHAKHSSKYTESKCWVDEEGKEKMKLRVWEYTE